MKVNKAKIFLILILAILSAFVCHLPASAATAGKKAVVIILDRAGWNNLTDLNNPHLQKLVDQNGIGYMNIRSKNIYLTKNPESSYLTMNVGIRSNAPDYSGQVRVAGKSLMVTDLAAIRNECNKAVMERLGLMGKIARINNLRVSLISFRSTTHGNQPAALMAMDEKGIIPTGLILPGSEAHFDQISPVIAQSDITFVDFGDTTLSPETLANASRFIGDLRGSKYSQQLLLMLVVPNPDPAALHKLNYSLTPFVIDRGQSIKGLATSKTTRRDGLVTNLDLMPTIYEFFGIRDKTFIGEPVYIKTDPNPGQKLKDSLNSILSLNIIRYLNMGIYIILSFILLKRLYSARGKTNQPGRLYRGLYITLLTLPALTLILVMVLGTYFSTLTWWQYLSVVAVLTFMISYLLSGIEKADMVTLTGVILALTALLYFYEAYSGLKNLLYTPYGYNDLIIGGRFYGINNDAMSIFVTAVILPFFIWQEKFRPSLILRLLAAVVTLGFLVMSFSSYYGANVGGSITALAVSVFAFIMMIGRKLSFRRFLLIVLAVFLIQVGFAAIDASFNPPLTHAGKAFQNITGQGWSGFLEILASKTYQLMMMVLAPPWNFLLLYQIYLLFKKRIFLQQAAKTRPYLYNGSIVLILGSIVGFSFNDTGPIVAAILLLYTMITLGFALVES